MIRELEAVVLEHDVKEHGLERGDVGAIVHAYRDGSTFEVEFVTARGDTVAVLTVTKEEIPTMGQAEILHAREITLA